MAVRARLVCVALVAALITLLEVSAEGGGTAVFDGLQHTPLPHGQTAVMRSAKLVAMGAHDIGDFQCGPHGRMAAYGCGSTTG
jgi:hypothetical protein